MFGATTNVYINDVYDVVIFSGRNYRRLSYQLDGVSRRFLSHVVGYYIVIRRFFCTKGKNMNDDNILCPCLPNLFPPPHYFLNFLFCTVCKNKMTSGIF